MAHHSDFTGSINLTAATAGSLYCGNCVCLVVRLQDRRQVVKEPLRAAEFAVVKTSRDVNRKCTKGHGSFMKVPLPSSNNVAPSHTLPCTPVPWPAMRNLSSPYTLKQNLQIQGEDFLPRGVKLNHLISWDRALSTHKPQVTTRTRTTTSLKLQNFNLTILGAAVPSTVATRSRSQDDAVLIKPLEGSEQRMESNISSAKWSCAHVE